MPSADDKPRRRRVNGEASQQKILEAATEIAAERGYEGTSIGLVSERSGLPASSIYWHFKDKDALIFLRDICDQVEFMVLALEHARLHLALCDLMARAKTCHAVRETAASILHSMCVR